MQNTSKYSREEIVNLLIKLGSDEMSEGELLARHEITAEELAHWRKENPLSDTLTAYSAHKGSRFGSLFLVLAVLDVAAMYVLHRYTGQSLKDWLSIPLAMVLCIAVLGLIYQDVERGVVKAGRRHNIRRDGNPFAFWSVIAVQALVMLAFAVSILMVVYRG